MLLLYSSLLHSSVYMILSWAASVPLLIDAGLSLVTGKRSRLLAPHIVPLVAAAAGATGACRGGQTGRLGRGVAGAGAAVTCAGTGVAVVDTSPI